MGRKKGFDQRKIASIISALATHQDGLWLRQIARETDLHPLTVKKYLETALSPLVEDVSLGQTGKPLLRIVRLKPFVIERLQEGKTIGDILKILNLLDKIER